jgi:hypothetical protein
LNTVDLRRFKDYRFRVKFSKNICRHRKAAFAQFFLVFVLLFGCSRDEGSSRIMDRENADAAGKAAAEGLKKTLAERNIDFEESLLFSDFDENEEEQRPSLSILVHFPGESFQEDSPLFILALPLTSSTDIAGVAPFRIRTALAFIEKIRSSKNIISPRVIVAFLGEDDFKNSNGGILDENENVILCYFDSNENPKKLLIRRKTAETTAPLFMIADLPRLCKDAGIPFSFVGSAADIFDFTQSQETGFLYLYGSGNEARESEKNSANGTAVTVNAEDLFAGLFFEYALSLKSGAEADINYMVLPFPNNTFFISEYRLVVLLLFAAGICLLGLLIIKKVPH